ncbi:hypothetical protein B0J17DRAFT_741326 [Rhizoctonia solani]|nr:hypothetical protein B0J17DRAFT_741326 [Rhizoctonia solani]
MSRAPPGLSAKAVVFLALMQTIVQDGLQENIVSIFLGQSAGSRPVKLLVSPLINVPKILWLSSSLIFDSITTLSTIVYIYRAGMGSVAYVIWRGDDIPKLNSQASAAPPLLLILIALIGGYIPFAIRKRTRSQLKVAKFFVLSLMINLVGRGYIRRLFERPYPTPGTLRSSRSQADRGGEPVSGGITAHTVDVELQLRARPEAIGTSAEGLGKCPSDEASIKSPSIVKEDGLGHTTHNIELSSRLAS